MLSIQEHVRSLGSLLAESNVEDVDGWSLAELANEEGYNFDQVLIACGILMERQLTIGPTKTKFSLQEIDGEICIACTGYAPTMTEYNILVTLFPGYQVHRHFDGKQFFLTADGPIGSGYPVWSVLSPLTNIPAKRNLTPEWAAEYLVDNVEYLSPPFGPWENLSHPLINIT